MIDAMMLSEAKEAVKETYQLTVIVGSCGGIATASHTMQTATGSAHSH